MPGKKDCIDEILFMEDSEMTDAPATFDHALSNYKELVKRCAALERAVRALESDTGMPPLQCLLTVRRCGQADEWFTDVVASPALLRPLFEAEMLKAQAEMDRYRRKFEAAREALQKTP